VTDNRREARARGLQRRYGTLSSPNSTIRDVSLSDRRVNLGAAHGHRPRESVSLYPLVEKGLIDEEHASLCVIMRRELTRDLIAGSSTQASWSSATFFVSRWPLERSSAFRPAALHIILARVTSRDFAAEHFKIRHWGYSHAMRDYELAPVGNGRPP